MKKTWTKTKKRQKGVKKTRTETKGWKNCKK